MSRLKMRAGIAGASAALVALTTVGASGLAQAAPKPSQTVLGGSTVPFTSHSKVIGYVSGSQALTVQLWLKPNLAAAARYATAASTPGSKLFHHYLSPAAYTAKFGASQASAAKVEAWLRGQGFTAVRTDAQRNYVRATATTARINAAFKVRETLYQPSASANAGHYPLRANNRDVSLPTSLAGSVLGVTGLENANPMLPLSFFAKRSFAVTNVISLAMYFGMFGSIFLLTQFLQNVLGNTPLQAGVKLLVWTGSTMIVAPELRTPQRSPTTPLMKISPLVAP